MKLFRSSALLLAAAAALSACAADFKISSFKAAAPTEALGDNEPLAATWTVSGDTALTALQLQTLGRVFVEYDASLATADNTTLAKIVLSGNSSALLDAFEVVVVENRESEAVEVHMKNDAFEGQGYLLTRVLVASKQTLRELSVAWSSDTVVGDDVLASSNATGTVSLSLAGSADVFLGSEDAAWTVGSLVTSVSGSGNIQLLAKSLAADEVNLSVLGSGDVAVVADEVTIKDSLASVVAGSGDITVQSGELTVYNLTTAIAGSGDVTYSKKGSCQEQAIALAGSGDVSAGSIVCVNTDVSLVGSGDVLVQTTGNLTVSSLFGSEIRYFGPEPSSISVSGLFNFRGSHKNTRKIVKEAKRNSYDEYDVEAAPKREPVYVLVKTSSSLFSNEPKIRYDLEIDTYDAETVAEFMESQGADYQVRLNVATTQNSVVAHAAVNAPGSALFAFVGAALVAVGVAATKYQRRATRASYQPLL